jgi:hypothetical protein
MTLSRCIGVLCVLVFVSEATNFPNPSPSLSSAPTFSNIWYLSHNFFLKWSEEEEEGDL